MNLNDQPKAEYYQVWYEESDPESMYWVELLDRGFSEQRFYNCQRINDWPDDVLLLVKGRPRDGILARLHWIIVSERVRQTVQKHQLDEVIQFLPIKVVNQDTGDEMAPYWVPNILLHLEALDAVHTRWLPGYDPTRAFKPTDHDSVVLRAGSILRPALRYEVVHSAHIFRLRERVTTLIISLYFKHCLESAGAIRGFEFERLRAY